MLNNDGNELVISESMYDRCWRIWKDYCWVDWMY